MPVRLEWEGGLRQQQFTSTAVVHEYRIRCSGRCYYCCCITFDGSSDGRPASSSKYGDGSLRAGHPSESTGSSDLPVSAGLSFGNNGWSVLFTTPSETDSWSFWSFWCLIFKVASGCAALSVLVALVTLVALVALCFERSA